MPAHATRTLALASHFLVIERPERALDALDEATPEERETQRYWSLLAEAYYQQAQYEAAREAALSGLSLFPEEIGLLRQLASACRQLKAYNAARAALQNALDRQPDNSNLYFDIAYLELNAGEYDSADKMLAQGEAIAPAAQHVLRLHALITHGRKQWQEAETYTRTWIERDPENSSAHYLLAAILARQARNLESKESLERAVQLDATSGAADDLRRVERRQSGCIGALILFASSGGVMMFVVGLLAYLFDDYMGGLIMSALAIPLTGFLLYIFLADRRRIELQANTLLLRRGKREQRIPYREITELRNGQFGIRVKTAQRRFWLYRIDQKAQAELFVDLRNRVPQTYDRLLTNVREPLPATVWGNFYTFVGMLALLATGVLLLYALYYNWASGNRDWGMTIVMGLMSLMVAVVALWRISELPLRLHFSVDQIRITYLIKSRCYPVDKLRHVGLHRGYRIFKGRQLADYKVELHFADGEILRLGEGEIRHPPDDWSPLYEVAARLQIQYGVTAPRHAPGQIGRFVI